MENQKSELKALLDKQKKDLTGQIKKSGGGRPRNIPNVNVSG